MTTKLCRWFNLFGDTEFWSNVTHVYLMYSWSRQYSVMYALMQSFERKIFAHGRLWRAWRSNSKGCCSSSGPRWSICRQMVSWGSVSGCTYLGPPAPATTSSPRRPASTTSTSRLTLRPAWCKASCRWSSRNMWAAASAHRSFQFCYLDSVLSVVPGQLGRPHSHRILYALMLDAVTEIRVAVCS